MEQAKQLSNEQLIELLESKKDEKLETQHLQEDDLSNFLSFYNITQGLDEGNMKELFKLYKHWSSNPMKVREFRYHLNKTFKIDSNSILLNKSKANINELLINKLNSIQKSPIKSKIIRSNIEKFLNHYQIKDGDVWTKGLDLYKLYIDLYNPIGPKKFYKLLQLYITTSETINNEVHFKIAPYEKEETNKTRQD